MKKFFSSNKIFLFLILALSLILGACTQSTPTPGSTSSQGTTTVTTSSSTTTTTGHSADFSPEEFEWPRNTTNHCTYSTSPYGPVVRTININTGRGGDPLTIVHMTDMHINYCTENDLLDPVLRSTYENRVWLKDGQSLLNVKRSLLEAEGADQIVITGDIYDYYSEGAVQKADEYIFNKYDNVLAAIGNHEPVRQMQGTVTDHLTYDELRGLVAQSWNNDISYESTVLGEKVMLIVLDNSFGFRDEQVPRLTQDLETAREKGYAVLLFYHVPLCTGKTEDVSLAAYWGPHQNWNFGTNKEYVGPDSRGVDATIYSLIRRNGDIIRGAFCGHVHGDFYTEIPARTIDGEETKIPQYIVTPVAYDSGHVLRINIT